MNARCGIAAAVLGLMLPLAVQAQEETKVTGRVVDASGKPIAGAEVATFWTIADDKPTPYKAATSDGEGRFSLRIEFYGREQGLLAYAKDRKIGGLLVVEPKAAEKPVEIKLGPLGRVHGKFFCKELNKRPKWTNVYLMHGAARFLMCASNEASFTFALPPGTYKFWGYGTDIQDVKKDFTLSADKPDLDMGTLDVPATVIAKHIGKAPPAWHVTDARGVKKDVKLADFKGKWVLMEFWGYW